MLRLLINRLIRKHGMKKLLLLVGDYAVRATKSRKDDKIWAKVRAVIESL